MRTISSLFAVVVALSTQANAQTNPTNLQVGSIRESTFSACKSVQSNGALATRVYQGSPTIRWQLFKDPNRVHGTPGTLIQTTTTSPPFAINGIDSSPFSLPSTNAVYYATSERKLLKKFIAKQSSSDITIVEVNNYWGTGPAFGINSINFHQLGGPGPVLQDFAPTTSDRYKVSIGSVITFNNLSCGDNGINSFISILKSDEWFNNLGPEVGAWLPMLKTGFNLKQFAQQGGISFAIGDIYRVKLAFGSPWREVVRLLEITP